MYKRGKLAQEILKIRQFNIHVLRVIRADLEHFKTTTEKMSPFLEKLTTNGIKE